MPNIIKNFNWKQSDTHIIIQIHFKVAVQSKLDTFISKRYIKIIYEQNFFEVILLFNIDDTDSKCIITPETIILELKKCDTINWETLEPVLSKEERNNLKKHLLENAFERIQKQNEEKCMQKAELKRIAVRKQIETDNEVRNRIENVKEHEKKIALGSTDQFIRDVKRKSISKCKKLDTKCCKSKTVDDNESHNEPKILRQFKSLQVDFTPREFPTPSRESKLEEENEWLSKQAAARRSCGFISEDIRPEERSPQFLKAKGDEFLRNKNYLGAISAYSYGIRISPTFVDFYIARSEAHFALGNYHKVISDCSSALEIMKPECDANLQERALCIARRGMALCKLGMKREGIEELLHSQKLKRCEYVEEFLDDVDSN